MRHCKVCVEVFRAIHRAVEESGYTSSQSNGSVGRGGAVHFLWVKRTHQRCEHKVLKDDVQRKVQKHRTELFGLRQTNLVRGSRPSCLQDSDRTNAENSASYSHGSRLSAISPRVNKSGWNGRNRSEQR